MISPVSTLCVLGVMIVGLLLIMNVIRPEQAVAAIARGFAALVLGLLTICLLKGLASAAITALAAAAHWIAITALAVAALFVVLALVARLTRRVTNPEKGDEL